MRVNSEIENKRKEIGNQETECKIHQVNEDLQVENVENQEPFQNSTPYQNNVTCTFWSNAANVQSC